MPLIIGAMIVGGQLLSGKIASNRAKDPKGPIGSGTAPTIQPGEGGQFTPVAGSQVQDFGDFEYENMMQPEMDEEQQLATLLQQLGLAEEGGVVNAAYGKVLEKADGGILNLLEDNPNLFEMAALSMFNLQNRMDEKSSGEVIDFTQPEIDEVSAVEQDMFQKELQNEALQGLDDIPVPSEELYAGTPFQETMSDVEGFAETNPKMFNAGIGALGDVLTAALRDMPEQKGSQVSTRTLPAGNAARRRSQLQNIMPLGGSTVTFAENGKVLKRPMFMPQGGTVNGPGGPRDDLVPVMASNGEYMLSKAAVDAAGGGSHAKGVANLNKFNEMGNRRYG